MTTEVKTKNSLEVKIYNTLEETINNDWIIKALKHNFSFGRRGLTHKQYVSCWEQYNIRMDYITNTFNNQTINVFDNVENIF